MCGCSRQGLGLMDADFDWMRELIEHPAGTPVSSQDLSRIRLYICLAADREVIDLVQILRESHDATGRLPRRDCPDRDGSPLNEPALFDRLAPTRPTRPTRPGTAAGVLELVRRGPDLFKALPVSYQLDALQAVVIRRNREQEEVNRSAAFAAVNAVAELHRQQGQDAETAEKAPRLRTWVEGQITELGFPSVGVNAFIDNMLDPETEERDYDFHDLLVDQKFSFSEMEQMLRTLADRLKTRVESLEDYEKRYPHEDEDDIAWVERKQRQAHELLKKWGDVEMEELSEEERVRIITEFLISIVGIEDLIVEFEMLEEEEGFPEYEPLGGTGTDECGPGQCGLALTPEPETTSGEDNIDSVQGCPTMSTK